jgi:integrase
MPVLTDASVRKYTAQAKRREIPDARATGLYLIIQPKPSGAKSWALRFRRPDGRPAKMALGRVDLSDHETKRDLVIGASLTLRQARRLAADIDQDRKTGLDVIEEHKAARERKKAAAADRAVNTFGSAVREFFIDYRTKRKTRQRRWRDTASLLGLRYKPGADPATAEPELIKGGLVSIWGDKPVASIDGHDVHAVVSEARKLGSEGRARKMHAALSVLFSWLLRERRVTQNPCSGVWRPDPPEPRERVLTDAEIVAFWRGCDSIGAPFGSCFQTMLLTGARLREVASMTRAKLDDDGVWTVPGSRTKNGRSLTLTLPPLAREIIGNLPVIEGGFVFTTTGRTPISGFSRAKHDLDAAVAKSAGRAVPFRLHDLRRTFVTGLAALGVALPVVERAVNHVSGSFGGVAGVYNKHDYRAEVAEALRRWATHVEGLVAERANVVAMKTKRSR